MEREPQPSARLLLSADFRASSERAFDLEAEVAAQRLEISRLHGRLRRLEAELQQGRSWLPFLSDKVSTLEDKTQQLAVRFRSLISIFKDTLGETEIDSTAATAVSVSARALSPTSDRERSEPISKMRRRWQLASAKTQPTALLPMEDSPGSSGAASSWHLVAPILAPHFDVESVSDGEDFLAANFCPAEDTGSLAPPARSLLLPTPKPKAWQRPTVCLRFNSPFQVDQPEPKPVAKPTGSCPQFKAQTRWAPQSPQQRERVSWSSEATPAPSFSKAQAYARYPSQNLSEPLTSTLQCPTPALLQPRVEPPGALDTKAVAFRAPRPKVKEAGFSRSKDLHDDLAQRNNLLFEQLCDLHFEISPVLGQIAASRYSEVLRGKLLAKVSDSTASRYLRSVQIFFTTFEELGGNIRQVDTGLLLDTFFVLSRCPEEGPLSNSLNVMKALRWYRKLLGLSPFPDLYSAAFSSLVQPASGEKRESMPLPLSFHAFLERKVLGSDTPKDEALWAGSFLACIGGSLRFSDAQHISWSSLCISHFTLRGICYRTKTTKRGAPFAFLGFGFYSSSREFGMNWLSAWILLLDSTWQGLRASFGRQVTPDCFFFTMGTQGFSPASYAQTLLRLRNFLQESGMQPEQAANYTLHSLKVTMLSWMAQLDLPLPARFQLEPENGYTVLLCADLRCTVIPGMAGYPDWRRDGPTERTAAVEQTPFSADYIHKLLKTLPESEKGKFLEMLAEQPVIDQQPASGQAGAKASASQPSPPAATPQTPPEFCDTVAQEAYMPPASQAAPSATPKPTAPAPQPGPAVAAAKPAGTAGPAAAAAKPAGTTAPKTVAQKQPPPKPAGPPAADPAATGPPQAYYVDSRFCLSSSNAFVRLGRVNSAIVIASFRHSLLQTGSMAAEFFSLMNDSSIPDNIREALTSYDTPLFARSCNDQEELASLISHLMDASDTSSAGDQILARASIRLLFSRCRESCGLPPLDDAKGNQQPTATTSPTTNSPAPNASSSWQESWPAKLSAERTAELRKRFEDDYPTELLDNDSFPSSRLLALTSKMVADKEIRWLPWKFRLSAKAQDDNLLIRPKKLPRLTELSDLLLDEAPSRDIHDGPASFNLINQLLTLATNSIALCRGAHLGSLKLYQKKFLKLCFTKYESASNLRGPTSWEAQAADKRAWELIGELVNIHSWKLDDALHEVTQVRADLSTLLAPRAQIPKHLFQLREPWRNRQEGKGNRAHLRGNGKGGHKGKNDSSSHAEDPPSERSTRGGKGKKGPTSSAGKWLSSLFMEGKQHTLCMRYQQGQCKDPSTCRYLHRCAVPKPDGTACGGKHPASQHVSTPH
ncbi:unnamed protein product [Symbiodinium necroappetens]|uniref:C3H1-type domain-containing protein n=1 Tax=Symbiodinium necroappetens TaxID=1628268 RepID=A0A812XAW1_9DINO|nr:unnamed protein product [Symbiodinium necroappetens]